MDFCISISYFKVAVFDRASTRSEAGAFGQRAEGFSHDHDRELSGDLYAEVIAFQQVIPCFGNVARVSPCLTLFAT